MIGEKRAEGFAIYGGWKLIDRAALTLAISGQRRRNQHC